MPKTLYVFQPHSIVDIITNSSSELFVFKGKTKNMVEEMIASSYPNYLKEYEELKNIDDLTPDELDDFVDYHCTTHQWPHRKDMLPLIGDYTFEELYEPKINHRTGEVLVARNGEIQYEIKDNTRPPKEKKVRKFDEFHMDEDPFGEEYWDGESHQEEERYHFRQFVTEKNFEEVKDRIDPKRKMYFLFSLDENPDWEYQQKLSKIGKRYHMG